MQNLQKLVDAAVDAYPNDIVKATESVLKTAKKKPWFAALVNELVRRAVRDMVNDKRHNINTAMRTARGDYGGPAKVTASAATNRIAQGVMAYLIAGKTLGMMTGDDLVATADSESEKASGHTFNAKLCRKLSRTVKGETLVRQKFNLVKLTSLFESV